jgi:hypothetical protein
MNVEELIALCRQRTPESLIAFYEWVYLERGMSMPDHLLPVVYALCDTRIRNLMLNVGPGAGKSNLLSIIYPAWEIGHDPSMTVLGISGAENSANAFMQAVMAIVQYSKPWSLIFPDVKPDKEAGWGGERGMLVTGHKPGDPDASFFAAGMLSRLLTSRHARLLILDDLHNDENSSTEEKCKDVVKKYYSLLAGRADPRGARFIMAGRRFHQSDIYGHFQDNPDSDWVVLRLPAERLGETKLYYDVFVPDDLECVFTDRMVFCADNQIVTV